MQKYRPVSSSKSLGKKPSKIHLLWIAIILGFLIIFLTSCQSSSRGYNACLKSAITWGQIAECGIALHEAQ